MDGSTKTRFRPPTGKGREDQKNIRKMIPTVSSTLHTIPVVAAIGDAAAASIGQRQSAPTIACMDMAMASLIPAMLIHIGLRGIDRVHQLQPPLWLHLHHVRRAAGHLSLPHVRRITLVLSDSEAKSSSICLGQWFCNQLTYM